MRTGLRVSPADCGPRRRVRWQLAPRRGDRRCSWRPNDAHRGCTHCRGDGRGGWSTRRRIRHLPSRTMALRRASSQSGLVFRLPELRRRCRFHTEHGVENQVPRVRRTGFAVQCRGPVLESAWAAICALRIMSNTARASSISSSTAAEKLGPANQSEPPNGVFDGPNQTVPDPSSLGQRQVRNRGEISALHESARQGGDNQHAIAGHAVSGVCSLLRIQPPATKNRIGSDKKDRNTHQGRGKWDEAEHQGSGDGAPANSQLASCRDPSSARRVRAAGDPPTATARENRVQFRFRVGGRTRLTSLVEGPPA